MIINLATLRVEHAAETQAARGTGALNALDAGCRTLHIRCGTDIMHKLAAAGFAGDFLNFSDPYAQGPLPTTATLDEFIRMRAEYLEQKYQAADALKTLTATYNALQQARDYPQVMLWFEHDSYDQLILAKLLHFFSAADLRPTRLKFISVTGFPGVQRFIGIGQLPAEALRVLWEQFSEVSAAQFAFAKQAWHALISPTPELLARLVDLPAPALPVMVNALHRHLQELPSLHNGLSLTEQLTLQGVAAQGPMNAVQLFRDYNLREPLPFLGDRMYWCVLDDLARAPHAAIVITRHAKPPVNWDVELTPLGQKLLEGNAHWLELRPVPRWVGGVNIDASQRPVWCYDRAQGVVARP